MKRFVIGRETEIGIQARPKFLRLTGSSPKEHHSRNKLVKQAISPTSFRQLNVVNQSNEF